MESIKIAIVCPAELKAEQKGRAVWDWCSGHTDKRRAEPRVLGLSNGLLRCHLNDWNHLGRKAKKAAVVCTRYGMHPQHQQNQRLTGQAVNKAQLAANGHTSDKRQPGRAALAGML